jgi:hypothetical protein
MVHVTESIRAEDFMREAVRKALNLREAVSASHNSGPHSPLVSQKTSVSNTCSHEMFDRIGCIHFLIHAFTSLNL